jgi:CRP-like cAMP-binding protein
MPDLTTHAVLEHNFMFHGLPERTLDALTDLAHRRSYEKGAMIFSQGDAGDALYGIASGKVRICAADDKGHEVFLNILGPGETFGEIAMIDGLQRTASAIAIEPSTLVAIPRQQFLSHLEHDPGLALHVMKLLCERLRWVSDLVEESAFLAGPARVAKRLTSLVESYGRPADGGGSELLISQAELGQFLGVSRQIINQYLRSWSEQGWVRLRRGRIIVDNLDALSQVADQLGDFAG